MHAKPDLRVVLKLDDRWFGLGDRGRYLAYVCTSNTPDSNHVLCAAGRRNRTAFAYS